LALVNKLFLLVKAPGNHSCENRDSDELKEKETHIDIAQSFSFFDGKSLSHFENKTSNTNCSEKDDDK